jgi:flagellar biosynthesis/type III secretory pathway protein FliH
MLQQRNADDENADLNKASDLLLDAYTSQHKASEIRALFPSHLRLLTSDGVLSRECLPTLEDAQAMLAAAQESADVIVQKAQQQAEDMRRNAELEGECWLDNKRDELLAEMYLQQSLWLSRLQPVWLEALETTLRKVVGETVRPDAFACAISLGLKEFKKEADLQLFVHPDDLVAAEQALTQLAKTSPLIVVSADDALSVGACQLRSADLEVSLQLDDALSLALGKS